MGRPGFEPETNRLKAECSTAELATRFGSTLARIAQIFKNSIKISLFLKWD